MHHGLRAISGRLARHGRAAEHAYSLWIVPSIAMDAGAALKRKLDVADTVSAECTDTLHLRSFKKMFVNCFDFNFR